MDIVDAIRKRKSIRAFKPEPVPESIIEEILREAILSPSSENSQPWEFSIIKAETARLLGARFAEMVTRYEPVNPDIRVPKEWEGVYGERGRALGKALFTQIGIPRGDREKRRQYYLKMYDFFGAPNAIYLYIDAMVYGYDWAMFDAGLIAQNIVLLATSLGLGTCIEGAVILYPDIVREILHLPQSKKLIVAVAIGYPDWDADINRFKSTREDVRTFIKAIR